LYIVLYYIWFVLILKCLRPFFIKYIAGTFRPFRNVRKQPAVVFDRSRTTLFWYCTAATFHNANCLHGFYKIVTKFTFQYHDTSKHLRKSFQILRKLTIFINICNSKIFIQKKSFRITPRLTTNQIADLVDDLDDDYRDPDYEEEKDSDVDMFEDSGDEDEEEEEGVNLDVVRRHEQPSEEIRIYMDPPIERADGDTDRDSGKTCYEVDFLWCWRGGGEEQFQIKIISTLGCSDLPFFEKIEFPSVGTGGK